MSLHCFLTPASWCLDPAFVVVTDMTTTGVGQHTVVATFAKYGGHNTAN